MRNDRDMVDLRAGMAWGAMTPALAGGILGLIGGPGAALMIFAAGLSIALAHVVLLALPLYGLLRLIGCRLGPAIVLTAAGLIGALPATLFGGPGLGIFGGVFGLMGGAGFCIVSQMRPEPGG